MRKFVNQLFSFKRNSIDTHLNYHNSNIWSNILVFCIYKYQLNTINESMCSNQNFFLLLLLREDLLNIHSKFSHSSIVACIPMSVKSPISTSVNPSIIICMYSTEFNRFWLSSCRTRFSVKLSFWFRSCSHPRFLFCFVSYPKGKKRRKSF